MIPLVDLHVHLLAGLDDGPRTDADALAMCRLAFEEGVRLAAATAHQNEQWNLVTPDRIRQACQKLSQGLQAEDIPLQVFPCAEVMVHPDVEMSWRKREVLSVADRQEYLLVEMPHGLFVDLRDIVRLLRAAGVRPILAHPERQGDLLHQTDLLVELVRAGCLVQVSSASITHPRNRRDARALKSWFQQGLVHVLGSDGHSPNRRPPRMADAYHQVCQWAGNTTADRVGSTNGMAILQGLPLRLPQPQVKRKRWFFKFW
ncbi:MAG: protein tyrosine phosphatase [Planctomycetes bacterium]|nr:protein tyrosine phosphatase [Planctomycetota bacterium]